MKVATSKGICALAFVYAALGVPAQGQTGNDTVIRHVRVFDGESVVNNTSVLIANGKVAAIGSNLSIPTRATVVEGKGRTLLPGLIDSHTHIRSRQDLEQSLALGVTTDVSMLMDVGLFRVMKQEQQVNRANDRADLFSSGYAATAPGATELRRDYPYQLSVIPTRHRLGSTIASRKDRSSSRSFTKTEATPGKVAGPVSRGVLFKRWSLPHTPAGN